MSMRPTFRPQAWRQRRQQMKSEVRRDGGVGGQAANARLKGLLADAMDDAALKDLLEDGLLLQPGQDEIRARGSGA